MGQNDEDTAPIDVEMSVVDRVLYAFTQALGEQNDVREAEIALPKAAVYRGSV